MNTEDSSNNDQTLVSVEQEKNIQLQHIQEERLKRIHIEAVNMVCRQTDYDEDTAWYYK
jgi:hypothetical protein